MPEPPNARDVAEKLLGACLRPVNEALDAAYDMQEVIETPGRFYERKHAKVAEAIFEILEEGSGQPDAVTVTQKLRDMGELESVGGAMYVTNLTADAAVPANAKNLSYVVLEKWIKRRLRHFGEHLVRKAQDDTTDALDLLDRVQNSILEINRQDATASTSAKERLREHLEATQMRRKGKNHITGLRLGWPTIDRLTSGLSPTDYMIVAARPSMGKTRWALNAGLNIIQNGGVPAFFSLEMSENELIDALAGCVGKINMQKISQGYGSDAELKRLAKAMKLIEKMDFHIVDSPSLTVGRFRAKARRMVAQEGVDVLIIDYLQLFNSTGNKKTREQEVAHISRQLKITARELETPVIALSQLNRKPMSRGGGKRPELSDLRESGAIEQDADIVSFLHRLERATDLDEHDKLGIDPTGVTDFILAKQRNGPTDTVYLDFEKKFGRFTEIDLEKDYGLDVDESRLEVGDGSIKSQTIPAWAQKIVADNETAEPTDVQVVEASEETSETLAEKGRERGGQKHFPLEKARDKSLNEDDDMPI